MVLYNDLDRQRGSNQNKATSKGQRILKLFARNYGERFTVNEVLENCRFNNDANSTRVILENHLKAGKISRGKDDETGYVVYYMTEQQSNDYLISLESDIKKKPIEQPSAIVEIPIAGGVRTITYPPRLFDTITNENYRFSVRVLNATPNPQTMVYLGLHQCYSSKAVEWPENKTEDECGGIAVSKLLEGNKGHYSPLEHTSITISFQGLNHGSIQQLLRSRVAVSPSVQSFRYTSKHLLEAVKADNPLKAIEDIIYLRPVNHYRDKSGLFYYSPPMRLEDLEDAYRSVVKAVHRINQGMPPEQARGLLMFDYRQHAVITFNLRSLMSLLDRRSPKDAQTEVRIISEMLLEILKIYAPRIGEWYEANRYGKNKLAP